MRSMACLACSASLYLISAVNERISFRKMNEHLVDVRAYYVIVYELTEQRRIPWTFQSLHLCEV